MLNTTLLNILKRSSFSISSIGFIKNSKYNSHHPVYSQIKIKKDKKMFRKSNIFDILFLLKYYPSRESQQSTSECPGQKQSPFLFKTWHYHGHTGRQIHNTAPADFASHCIPEEAARSRPSSWRSAAARPGVGARAGRRRLPSQQTPRCRDLNFPWRGSRCRGNRRDVAPHDDALMCPLDAPLPSRLSDSCTMHQFCVL